MSTPDKDDLPVWKLGNEFSPFHPSASHIDPSYRDGWNHCYAAALAQIAELRERLEQATKKPSIGAACGPIVAHQEAGTHQPNWSQAISDEAFNAAIAAAKAKGLRLDDQGGDRN